MESKSGTQKVMIRVVVGIGASEDTGKSATFLVPCGCGPTVDKGLSPHRRHMNASRAIRIQNIGTLVIAGDKNAGLKILTGNM